MACLRPGRFRTSAALPAAASWRVQEAGADARLKLYKGKTHTKPIVEDPSEPTAVGPCRSGRAVSGSACVLKQVLQTWNGLSSCLCGHQLGAQPARSQNPNRQRVGSKWLLPPPGRAGTCLSLSLQPALPHLTLSYSAGWSG